MSKKANRAERDAPIIRTTPTVDDNVNLYGNVGPVTRVHLSTIEKYCTAMAPGVPVSETDGAHYQLSLYRALMGIIDNDNGEEMYIGCDEVLKFFKRERKGALNFNYTQRFIDKVMLSTPELDLYSRLCLLFSTFCTPEGIKLEGKYFTLDTDKAPFTAMSYGSRERFSYYFHNLLSSVK